MHLYIKGVHNYEPKFKCVIAMGVADRNNNLNHNLANTSDISSFDCEAN